MFDIGTVIDDRYELIAHIGDGGMGSVFKAREIGLERVVAIKLVRPELLIENESKARFRREWQMLSQLVHPNIVALYRFGVWQNKWPYFAMEYLEGESLRQRLDNSGALQHDLFFKISEQICLALQAAHEAGIIHRDLKPGNVMITNASALNTVKIVDFGVAGFSNKSIATQKLTQTGELVGSVHYMSPEQCKGAVTDARSDIYSIGCLFYELLAGKPPLQCDNPVALLQKHIVEYPEEITGQQKELPAGLNNVLFKAIAKEPQDRYQSMDELRKDLALVAQGAGSQISAPPLAKAKQCKSPALLAGALSIVSIACTALFLVSVRSNEQKALTVAGPLSRDVRVAKLTQDLERYKNRVRLAKAPNEKDSAVEILCQKQGELVDTLLHESKWLDAESLVQARLETSRKIKDEGVTESRVLHQWANICKLRARISSDQETMNANNLRALELLEQSKRALQGRIDIGVLECRSVIMAQLGRIKESFDLFNQELRLLKSLQRDPSNNRKDFQYYTHELNAFARPVSTEDKLLLCDINLGIYEHDLDGTIWEAKAIMTRMSVPHPLKLDSVMNAERWLMEAYPTPPQDAARLALYRQRKDLIDKYEEEFRRANPGP